MVVSRHGRYITPVYEYQHADGNCSVTGGEVYRGGQSGNLFGHYVFTDFCVPSLRTLQKQGASFNYLAHSTWSVQECRHSVRV